MTDFIPPNKSEEMKKNKVTSHVQYLGELRCESTHLRSGKKILSDAPIDNHGKGEAFSPTDLVATALGKCIVSIIGIKVRDMGLNIEGSTVEVTKIMASSPRRIDSIHIQITMRGNVVQLEDRVSLERVARACPVAKSLHPDLEQVVEFVWE